MSGPENSSNVISGNIFENAGINFNSDSKWFTAESERRFFCTGHFPKDSWEPGNFEFSEFSSTTGVGFLSLHTISGTLPKTGSRSVLLTAAVNSKNTAMGISGFPGNSNQHPRLTSKASFGRTPILSEIPEGTISLNSNSGPVKVFALDEKENRKTEVSVHKNGSCYSFDISKKYKTLWFEIVLN